MNSIHNNRRSAVSLARKFIALLQYRYKRWPSTVRWLEGKTIQCRILREASAELTFSDHKVKATTRWISQRPDLAFVMSRKTLLDLIEGDETPTEAVFNGTLRVAGGSDDLTRTHYLFIDILERLSRTSEFEQLVSEFKHGKIKPLRRRISLHLNDKDFAHAAFSDIQRNGEKQKTKESQK